MKKCLEAARRALIFSSSATSCASSRPSLVEQADVVIENFRPDVMQRLGLDYDTLAEINPRLIMLSISGFGANNSDSRRAAYAPIIHAETGLIARQAELTGAFPTELPLSVADTNASMHGLVGLLAALYAREKSGRGDHVEISMVDATVVTNDGMHYALEGINVGLPTRCMKPLVACSCSQVNSDLYGRCSAPFTTSATV